ncbi:MAG: YggT family protein [Burkholderiaceae bacterium]
MLYQIISLLLDVLVGVLAATALLRLYLQHQRIGMSQRSGNPLGRFIFAVTDWLVLPLRRVIPSLGRWDMASLTAALLLEFSQYLVLWLLSGAQSSFMTLPILAVFGLARLVISCLTGLVIVYAVLSWVPSHSELSALVGRLCGPPLSVIRRYLPLVGGIDLSPLLLLLMLQVLAIVLASVQQSIL